MDPGDPHVFPWMLVLLIISVAALTADGADTFIYEMYSGNRSAETIAEGFNFSVQTVTTVGYGNWPLRDHSLTATNDQYMELRTYSIFLMAMGASLFTVTMGMTTTWLMQLRLLCLSGCFSKPQAVVYGRAATSISENLARVPIDVR